MKRVGIGVFLVCLLALALSTSALDRTPTQAEMDKIEAIRRMVAEKGYAWQAGPTSVSNLSPEDFQRLLGTRMPPDFGERFQKARKEGRIVKAPQGMYFPPSFDWRAQGEVTRVVNQGACGSCWAFCAAAAMEAQILIQSGMAENISEQAVLSCNTEGDGCGGGWMETAYDLWRDYGAVREACMPYHENDTDPCIHSSCDVVATVDTYYYVEENTDALKTALLDGPVAVAMAVCGGFGSYTGGCYEDNCTEINHGVTLVGWDDTVCGGQGAWIVKNSWGPDWGENGYIYMKYGTCYIGYGAAAIGYTPDQTAHFFHDSHTIDDGAADGDGNIETDEIITLSVTILNIGAETATNVSGCLESLTTGVSVMDSVAAYPDIPKGETGMSMAPHFSFTVTPSGPSCGQIRLHLAISSNQGTSHINITVQSGGITTVFEDDFESDQGWTVGASDDDAKTGLWQRGDPDATWWGNQPVQPGDDHTAYGGTNCYVTGASAGSSQGTYDVDGGKTTLLSPLIDLSDKGSAVLTYYRWYASETGSNPNDDDFMVSVSNSGGANWVGLDTLTYSDRQWTRMEFYLEDYVALTGEMKFRFIAQDNGLGGSIVEAAIDDFTITACDAPVDTEAPVVTIVRPNGGEHCEFGTHYDIQWAADDNVGVVSVTLVLSTDCGATFPDTIAAGEPNDGSYTWAVPDLDSKHARIKVVAVDPGMNEGDDTSDGDFTLWGRESGIEPIDLVGIPGDVILKVMSGNPTASFSRIGFGLPTSSHVELGVYDVTGKVVENLASGRRGEGYHVVDWNGGGPSGSFVGPGIYFVRLDCEEGRRTAKLVIAR